MISRIVNWYRNRFIRKAFAQLEAGSGVLLLTSEHMLAYIDYRLAARRAFRSDRQKAARKGAETRRARA